MFYHRRCIILYYSLPMILYKPILLAVTPLRLFLHGCLNHSSTEALCFSMLSLLVVSAHQRAIVQSKYPDTPHSWLWVSPHSLSSCLSAAYPDTFMHLHKNGYANSIAWSFLVSFFVNIAILTSIYMQPAIHIELLQSLCFIECCASIRDVSMKAFQTTATSGAFAKAVTASSLIVSQIPGDVWVRKSIRSGDIQHLSYSRKAS